MENQAVSLKDKFKFYKGLDYPHYDLTHVGIKPIETLMMLSEQESACIGFNTLGFLKCHIDVNKLISPNCYPNENDGIYVNIERYEKNNLYVLTDKYHLDKSIIYGHNYIPTYEKFFNVRRKNTKKVLEIGIGCLEEGHMSHMAHLNYLTGNSLRMWRDYFQNALICGIDIYEKAMITNEQRIMTIVADQSNENSLQEVINKFGSDIDIIIDDGFNQLNHQVFSFMFLEKYLSKKGIYIIENIFGKNLENFKNLSFFPDKFRNYINENYNVTIIDSRGIHNTYNDIMCIFERKFPIVYVSGISGLTNNIFQLAAAIPYAEKYNAMILMDIKKEILHYGTSNKFGRDVCRRVNSIRQSYIDTIFSKLDTTYDTSIITHIVWNDCFSVNKLFKFNEKEGEKENLDVKILIEGYCQNIELFFDYKEKLFDYLNLSDKDIINYVQEKYKMNNSIKNIMLGIRIGEDFKHMTKIKKESYTNALEKLITDNEKYHIYILSDVINGWEKMIDNKYLSNVTLVNEDDIVQIYVGLACNNFICSESTYHYIIALLAYIEDQNKKVIVFNDTDLTNRRLSHLLIDWIKINY